MSIAHGEQIVVSLATSTLVRDGSFELVDLGEHRLRDLTNLERVFQVCAPGLARDFPPLRSLDTIPGNLPRHRGGGQLPRRRAQRNAARAWNGHE